MKSHVVTTGLVFALLVVAHLWRIMFENSALARERGFLVITGAAAGLFGWSVVVLRQMRRRSIHQ